MQVSRGERESEIGLDAAGLSLPMYIASHGKGQTHLFGGFTKLCTKCLISA